MVFFAGYVSKCLDSTIETTVASQNSDNQKCQVWMRIDYLMQTFHANSSLHTTPLLSTNDQDPPFFLPLDPHVYPGICSALPFRPLYSLQILAALARLPSPFRFIHSLPGTTPAPTISGRKLTAVRRAGRVCLSELVSSVPVRGWPSTKGEHSTPAHSLDGKKVSGCG